MPLRPLPSTSSICTHLLMLPLWLYRLVYIPKPEIDVTGSVRMWLRMPLLRPLCFLPAVSVLRKDYHKKTDVIYIFVTDTLLGFIVLMFVIYTIHYCRSWYVEEVLFFFSSIKYFYALSAKGKCSTQYSWYRKDATYCLKRCTKPYVKKRIKC